MRKTATKEAVFAAADELQALGIQPNHIEIIKRVGGSNNTVGPYLSDWLQLNMAPTSPVPSDLNARAKHFVASVWNSAAAQAAVEIARIQAESQSEISHVQAQLADSLDVIAGLEDSRLEMLRELEKLQRENADLRVHAREVGEVKRELLVAVSSASLSRAEAEGHARLAAELQGEIKVLRQLKRNKRTLRNGT